MEGFEGLVEVGGGWLRPGPEFCDSAACVEIREQAGWFQMRDSKNPGGPVLSFDRTAWGAFLATVGTIDRDISRAT